jgi:hypothetical protein
MATLRERKAQAHFYFDSLWKEFGFSRDNAYIELAYRLGVPEPKAHFGNMTTKTEVNKALKLLKHWKAELVRDRLLRATRTNILEYDLNDK